MNAPRSRRTLALSAAGFAAIGGAGTFVVMNALNSAPPVVNFAPAAAADDVQSTVTSVLDSVTNPAAGNTTTTTAAPTNPAPDPSTAPHDRAHCDHDGDHQQLDDATAAKVKAAAEKAVPDATVKHVDHDRSNPDGYVAMMEKADDTHVLVHEDANFNVTKIEDPAPQRGPGDHHRGGPRDDTPPQST